MVKPPPLLALTHAPSPNLDAGLRTFAEKLPVNLSLAYRQHAAYCDRLRELGVSVQTLKQSARHPDATFIEDVAVVLDEIAILASMGTPERQAESAAMLEILRHHRQVARIEYPAMLEGGDVLRIGRTLFVGQSQRTNREGATALAAIVEPLGYQTVAIPVTRCLHLKTACTALPDGRLLVNPDWLDPRPLEPHPWMPIPPEEPWSANTLLIGDTVLVPAAHPRCAERIHSLGFDVSPVDISEFAKVEGGVTCLSLLMRQDLD